MSDTNQVRQILMNELGLTREFIREQSTDIIEQIITKQLGSGLLERTIRSAVKDGLNEILKQPQSAFHGNALHDMVRSAIAEEVKKQIAAQLDIEVRVKANVPE